MSISVAAQPCHMHHTDGASLGICRCIMATDAVGCGRRNKVQTLRKTREDAEAEDFKACAEHFVRCGASVLMTAVVASRGDDVLPPADCAAACGPVSGGTSVTLPVTASLVTKYSHGRCAGGAGRRRTSRGPRWRAPTRTWRRCSRGSRRPRAARSPARRRSALHDRGSKHHAAPPCQEVSTSVASTLGIPSQLTA